MVSLHSTHTDYFIFYIFHFYDKVISLKQFLEFGPDFFLKSGRPTKPKDRLEISSILWVFNDQSFSQICQKLSLFLWILESFHFSRMNTENFTLNGSEDGITFNTTKDQDTYQTVFKGNGFEATFHFKDNEINGRNPLDMLRDKISTINSVPNQFAVPSNAVYNPPTYFV